MVGTKFSTLWKGGGEKEGEIATAIVSALPHGSPAVWVVQVAVAFVEDLRATRSNSWPLSRNTWTLVYRAVCDHLGL